eukprot:GHUV01051711.1.p1 GENE.GHUV01051711.1~~GHUV01051711.1.p1  ORF type:complete len:160 (-),score=24.88 GHUV01051711.1:201-680(-)
MSGKEQVPGPFQPCIPSSASQATADCPRSVLCILKSQHLHCLSPLTPDQHNAHAAVPQWPMLMLIRPAAYLNNTTRGLQNSHSLPRPAGVDVASIKNPGVEAREAQDKQLQLKSRGEGQERLAESTAALQRKSELYQRLAKGEVDDDDEKYEVGLGDRH